jgi:hypothetical protein
MSVSRAMRRLLHVREIEEEQCKAAVESALGGLRRLQGGLAAAQERERRGRLLVTAGAATGDLVDRVGGLEETGTARRQAAVLTMRIAEAEQNVMLRRQEFVAKRVERRQVEAIVQRAGDEEAMEAGRRAQREMDDWCLGQAR